jgi:hypothetical protein
MPRQATRVTTDESFCFAVDDWDFSYGMHVNTNLRLADRLGPCWENAYVVLRGRLLSKTRRPCRQVSLTLRPGAAVPEDWKPEWKSFGRMIGVRRGTLMAAAHLPSGSFQSLLTALSAGKVRRCDRHTRRAGCTRPGAADPGPTASLLNHGVSGRSASARRSQANETRSCSRRRRLASPRLSPTARAAMTVAGTDSVGVSAISLVESVYL